MGEPSDDTQKSRLLADFLSMCRLCLSKSIVKVDIFNDNQSVSLPLRIMACASLEVSSSDQLPKRICDECRYQLEKSYVFRKRCKNSDTKLRRYWRQLNAGKITELFENSDDEEEYAESQNFFLNRQQEKLQQLEKVREDRERDFQQRMKNFMEDERRRFHYEEAKLLLVEEKRDDVELNTSINQLKKGSQNIKKPELEIPSTTGLEEEPTSELFEEEKCDEMEEEYEEPEEQETQVQNDEEFEFILNEEPEDNIPTSENNLDESVEYEENDNEVDSDYEPENDKESDSNTNKEPLVLNRNLKSSISMGEDIVFSLKADKSNQYIIKPGTSKTTEIIEAVEESEPNVNEKSAPIEDIDFDHLTKAVRSILAQQVGLNVDEDVKFKILKRRENVAEVEVRTIDGTIIVMEVELDTMLKDNNEELKIFGCTQCPRAFSRKAQLQRHSSTHVKEKGLSCEYCEKWFPSKSGLDRHVRVHTGEKPFKCDVCGKCFIQKEILKRHTMVHTGERPFKCEYCDKRFIQNDMLRYHIKRNHSDNPMLEVRKCPLCSKTFSYASGLSRHLTVHTGKLFPCSYCSKKFNDRSAHKRHVSTVHRVIAGFANANS